MTSEHPNRSALGGDASDLDAAARALRIQILASEHWSLLATRNLSWNESFSRATMFLTVLTGAVVALALPPDSYEYPLFGRGATRWLQPVAKNLPRDTWTGRAHWLLYDTILGLPEQVSDIHLGHRWRLRRLLPEAPTQPVSAAHVGSP